MIFTRKQTALILTLCALFFGFSLLNASWTASAPVGGPKLIASGPAALPVDAKGCIIDPESGYGATLPSVEVRMLQAAIGSGAAALNVPVEIGGKTPEGNSPLIARNFQSNCAADNGRPRAMLSEAAATLPEAELFYPAVDAASVPAILAAVPAAGKAVFYGNDAAVAAIKKARPSAAAFSLDTAQSCVSDYKASGWTGTIPGSCKGGTALVTMDRIGFSLWGWPNRFLARMQAGGVRIIIAQDVKDSSIIGLTTADQYGEIASSYNGYIWVDDIAELGPALKR